MALQRNVVYTVTRWMDEWTDEWMDGCVKSTEAHRRGLEQELVSDHCFSFLWCQSFGCVSTCFPQLYWRRKRGCSENPADMKTVRYCFVTFFLNFLLRLPL